MAKMATVASIKTAPEFFNSIRGRRTAPGPNAFGWGQGRRDSVEMLWPQQSFDMLHPGPSAEPQDVRMHHLGYHGWSGQRMPMEPGQGPGGGTATPRAGALRDRHAGT